MVVVVASWKLGLPGCASLKEKRRVVKSLKERMISRFHLSVAETAYHEVWSTAELTAALVSTDSRYADSVLSKVDRFLESDGRALILATRRSEC